MASDPSVIAALEAALAADEANVALRAHLAGLLCEERPADALAHAQRVLSIEPTHREAISVAQLSAKATGQADLAASYQRLLEALRWSNAAGMIESEAPQDDDPFDGDDEEPQRLRMSCEPSDPTVFTDPEQPKTTLKDVAGMEAVKRRLEVAFLGPMRNPELRSMYGKSLRGGLMMYGPPGCGKTYIARALAGEMGMQFLGIGLSDVLDMYLGESERKLHELFLQARRLAPVVLFFDEIDALGRKRSLMREGAGRTVVNQLLSELDGLDEDNEGLFVVSATNHPWDVDSALRRPGRFDRTVFVPPPDAPARVGIAKMNLEDRPHEKIDFDRIGKETNHFSGADIAHLVESAVEHALTDAIERGTARPVNMNDFNRALKDVRPSTRSWFETAKNYAIYANDGGSFDALVEYMREKKLL